MGGGRPSQELVESLEALWNTNYEIPKQLTLSDIEDGETSFAFRMLQEHLINHVNVAHMSVSACRIEDESYAKYLEKEIDVVSYMEILSAATDLKPRGKWKRLSHIEKFEESDKEVQKRIIENTRVYHRRVILPSMSYLMPRYEKFLFPDEPDSADMKKDSDTNRVSSPEAEYVHEAPPMVKYSELGRDYKSIGGHIERLKTGLLVELSDSNGYVSMMKDLHRELVANGFGKDMIGLTDRYIQIVDAMRENNIPMDNESLHRLTRVTVVNLERKLQSI
jgi:hypothetical protein